MAGRRSFRSLAARTRPDQGRRAAACKIIEGPADEAGVAVHSELLAALLSAAREMAGALPLLALTLEKLFAAGGNKAASRSTPTHAMGGLQAHRRAAAAPIDQAIDADPALQAASDRLFARLATVIDELPTRRSALNAPLRTDPTAASLLDALRSQGFSPIPTRACGAGSIDPWVAALPRLQHRCERYGEKLAIFAARPSTLRLNGTGQFQRPTWLGPCLGTTCNVG